MRLRSLKQSCSAWAFQPAAGIVNLEAQAAEVHEALHKYVRKAGLGGFEGLESADPLSESLPEHLAWLEDEAQFPPGTRAFADCGYMVAQLV